MSLSDYECRTKCTSCKYYFDFFEYTYHDCCPKCGNKGLFREITQKEIGQWRFLPRSKWWKFWEVNKEWVPK